MGSWFVGLLSHVMVGGLAGVAYGKLFTVVGESGWLPGVVIGIAHGLFAGLMLGFVPLIHPLVPERIADPGPFLASMSTLTALVFVALHALFGAIVGELYQPLRVATREVKA
jgi:uncharacterized membrane protein YeaQ/YmgE (transglycosylase-associated protein family)